MKSTKQSQLKIFGEELNALRIKKGYSLREICKIADYDSSNWSKVERGLISPPSDRKILTAWATILGLTSKDEVERFIDAANIAQGIIPEDILAGNMVEHLPAFFRTVRNKNISKADIDKLIELLRKS